MSAFLPLIGNNCFRDEADPAGSALRMVTYLRSVDSGNSVLRVNALRPTTFAVVIIITAGCLAALPFRREGEQGLDSPASRSNAGGEDDSMTASSSAWPQYPGFDPSLAWQPVPMTLPDRPITAQPPMPDSYYDLAFELERPEPVRERFGAVAVPAIEQQRIEQQRIGDKAAEQPSSDEKRVADRFTREPVRTIRPASQRPADTSTPPTADNLITDRFEFTPLEPLASRRRWPTDPPPTPRSAIRNASTGPTQRDASQAQHDVGQASQDRPRYFIREPD